MIQIIKSNESPRGKIDYGVAWKQPGLHQLYCNTGGGEQKFLSGSLHVSKKKPLPLVIKQMWTWQPDLYHHASQGLALIPESQLPSGPWPWDTWCHHPSMQEAGLLGVYHPLTPSGEEALNPLRSENQRRSCPVLELWCGRGDTGEISHLDVTFFNRAVVEAPGDTSRTWPEAASPA